jgi:hypothetical protein
LVLTNELKSSGARTERAELTKALLGTQPISAGSVTGLDGASAAELEKERLRLAPILGVLASAHPPIPAEKILSIQGWTTELGFARMTRAVAMYQEALARGRIALSVSTTGGDLGPETIDDRWRLVMQMFGGCPPNRPISGCTDHVNASRRGVIWCHPRRAGPPAEGWATGTVEITDLLPGPLPQGGRRCRGSVHPRLGGPTIANARYPAGAGVRVGGSVATRRAHIDPATEGNGDVAPNNGNPEFGG